MSEILTFDVLGRAGAEVLAGQDSLGRPVRWVHSSEIYEIGPLLSGGELLLTTGLGLAGADAGACRHYVRELDERGVTGVAVELGRSLPDMPYAILDESRRRGLPLVALRRVVPFIRITEAVNTAIVTRTLGELPYRPDGAAAVLADMEAGTALSQQEVTARLRTLGFRPERSHRLIGVAGHAAEPAAAAAALDRAADRLGGSLLRAAAPGAVTALLAVPGPPAGDPVSTARTAVGEASAGGGEGLTFALGPAVRPDGGWRRWGETLREARATLRLALTVPLPESGPATARGGTLVTTSRALALERQLAGDGLTAAARDRLAALVDRTLGPLLGWEAAHPSDLVHTLEVHLRNGCSPTRTAALLHVGRQSLYQRLDRIESLLGLPVADPEAHGELLLAACAHRLLRATE
ncbi:PucR family transcriptional regulator [Actinacidiphila sp. ITFR-21]|uniref:PucR family transcriptional regulator n=1 Tax=Actinacidiphila sp. ITFR-21 TaxID=3075199 RepID=UPI00288B2BD8|nr:PucR family transcriptional regulator [Streptomyces sp. ITFR-21]WNI19451.1 PucR family transcriptional regulator [Streptomyces sp. ITFR-21]